MASLTRLQGDGMDSEALKVQDVLPPSPGPIRHHNLNTSPNTATISKNPKGKYIPHEPVKGAVKPLIGPDAFIQSTVNQHYKLPSNAVEYKKEHFIPHYEGKNPNYPNARHSKVSIYSNPEKPEPLSNDHGRKYSLEKVKTIQVPIYQGPGHLQIETYQTLQRKRQQQNHEAKMMKQDNKNNAAVEETVIEIDVKATPESAKETAVNINERRVEGEVASGYEKLNAEITELKRKLDIEIKVNTDLKKMLVASMGDDLHSRVECLIRTKSQLAAEVGGYSQKVCQDSEELDKLAIQADMWRSKYMACRVMADEVIQQRALMSQRCHTSEQTLQLLLHEQQKVKENLLNAYRQLKQIEEAMGTFRTKVEVVKRPKDYCELATSVQTLSDNTRFRLLGMIASIPSPWDINILDITSPGEVAAFKVLSEQPTFLAPATLKTTQHVPVVRGFPRFHPHTRYENITISCCKNCKGDIHVV